MFGAILGRDSKMKHMLPLSQTDSDDDDMAAAELMEKPKFAERASGPSWPAVMLIMGKAMVFCVALWLVLHYSSRGRLHVLTETIDCWCGESTAEAKAKGCVFDELSTGWAPPHCIDQKASDAFMMAGNEPDGRWPYYLYPNGTGKIHASDLWRYTYESEDGYWTTNRWHMVHCSYMSMRQYRELKLGVITWNESFQGEEHVPHCLRMIMEVAEGKDGLDAIRIQAWGKPKKMKKHNS